MLLLLASALADPLPLAVGNTWNYRVDERKGGGTRVLLFFGTPPTTRHLADWTLSIVRRSGSVFHAVLDRAPVDGEATRTDLTLEERDGEVWMKDADGERLAVAIARPPLPVSSERVRCVANVLGGVVGSCAPLAGGPLRVDPGLHQGVIPGSRTAPNALGQFLVGVVSAGMILPASGRRSEQIQLVAFTPGPRQPALPKRGSAVEKAAADLATLAEGRIDDALPAALDRLSENQRYPVLRVALGRSADPLRTLARVRSRLPQLVPEAESAALLALVHDRRSLATTVLSARESLVVTVLAERTGTSDEALVAAIRKARTSHPVTVGAGEALGGLPPFDEGRVEVLDALWPGLPESDRSAALGRWLGVFGFDRGRLQFLMAHPLPVDGPTTEALLRTMTFDPARIEAVGWLLAQATDPDAVLEAGFRSVVFDKHRLALLDRHGDRYRALPIATRRSLLEQVQFAKDEARPRLGL